MSSRLNSAQLASRMYEYLLQRYSALELKSARWCTDTRVFDEPEVAFYPDTENCFPSCIRAMEYILEEGLPVWVVKNSSNFPMDVFTYRKLELLFDL